LILAVEQVTCRSERTTEHEDASKQCAGGNVSPSEGRIAIVWWNWILRIITVASARHYEDQIKEDEIGEARNTHAGDANNIRNCDSKYWRKEATLKTYPLTIR